MQIGNASGVNSIASLWEGYVLIGKKDAIGIVMTIFVLSSSITIYLLTIDHGTEVEHEMIFESYMSPMEDARTMVITDNDTWSSLWSEIHHVNGPPPRILYVNFTHEWLIVVSLGTRSSGGYILNIDSVCRCLICYKVFYSETVYGLGITDSTYPLQVVKISDSAIDLPVCFFYSSSEPVIRPE